MEYTKDMIFNVSYGQAQEKGKFKVLEKLAKRIMKHKFITITVCMTCLLVILDFLLISSFVSVLSGI